MKKLLGFGLLLLVFNQAIAEGISIRQWTNDLGKLETDVFEPLREEFKGQPCRPGFEPYIGTYLKKLQEIRSEVNSASYLLFREIALSTGQSIAAVLRPKSQDDVPSSSSSSAQSGLLSCESEADKWPIIERQIKVFIEYTGNMLSLMDVAGEL